MARDALEVRRFDAPVPYADALALLDTLAERSADAADVLLLLDHPPVITIGRRGGHDHVHARTLPDGTAVALFEIARGGDVTYHAPGQLVAYPVVRLGALEGPAGRGPLGDVVAYLRLLEDAIVEASRALGVEAHVRPGLTGVWTDARRKLASIGVGVRNGWTQHGLALNVTTDLAGTAIITPCGLDGVTMTSIALELARTGYAAPPNLWDRACDLMAGALGKRLKRRRD